MKTQDIETNIAEIDQNIFDKRTELSNRSGPGWSIEALNAGDAELNDLMENRRNLIRELNEASSKALADQARSKNPVDYGKAEKEVAKIDHDGFREEIAVINDLCIIGDRAQSILNLYIKRQALVAKFAGLPTVSDFAGTAGIMQQLCRQAELLKASMRVISSQIPNGPVAKIFKEINK